MSDKVSGPAAKRAAAAFVAAKADAASEEVENAAMDPVKAEDAMARIATRVAG
jgi:hypothetical protein